MVAIKIKMKVNCYCSNNLQEIDSIYLSGISNEGYYRKEDIYDYLKQNTKKIYVNIAPYPNLQPVLSKNGEKYVRSIPNSIGTDNLLCLPRE